MHMEEAYSLSAEIVNQEEATREGKVLNSWQREYRVKFIVVPGEYDTAELVLDSLGLDYSVLSPDKFDGLTLARRDVVIVNCPGEGFSERGLGNLKENVAKGGLLVTTDWALKHVIERAFPGFIEHNGVETSEDFVDIRSTDKIVDYLKDLIRPGLNPVWWLEGSSYPIKILSMNVRTLLVSREMKARYQDPTIACLIHFGKGQILHMTSHLFLSRAPPADKGGLSGLQAAMQRLPVARATIARLNKACLESTSYRAIEAAYVLENLLVRVLKNHGWE